MTTEEIKKMFEGRWHFKIESSNLSSVFSTEEIKEMCFDFFQAGCLICQPKEDIEITSDDFEQWWCAYDKKVGKEKAKKLWSKLSLQDRMSCIEYTPAYVASTSEKKFRKNPETFLRNKSWNDEIIHYNNATDRQSTLQQQRLSKFADIMAG